MKIRIGSLAASIVVSALFLFALTHLFLAPLPVFAATLTVGTDCATIEGCISLASDGDTIQIPNGTYATNVTVTKRLTFNGADTNNTILDGGGSGRVMNVTSNVPVTLTNLTVQNGAIVTSTGAAVRAAGPLTLDAVLIQNNTAPNGGGVWTAGSLSIASSIFNNNQCTAALCTGGGVQATGPAQVTGTTFISNTSIFGAGIWSGADLTVEHATFISNVGGGVRSAGLNLLVQNSTFIGNGAPEGGGIHADFVTIVNVNDSYFADNYCNVTTCRGGALFFYNGGSVSDSQFIGNQAESAGGGAWALDDLNIANSLFEGNFCTLSSCAGGAIAGIADVTITGSSLISGNIATGSGGGLYVFGNLNLDSVVLRQNSSGNLGGAAWSNGSMTVNGVTVAENQAMNGGGGLYGTAGIDIDAATITTNTTEFVGGGLATLGALNMTNSTVAGNSAEEGGGGAWSDGSIDITGGRFDDNTSLAGGGAIAVSNIGQISGTTFAGNYAIGSGGAVLIGGTGIITNVTAANNEAETHGGSFYAVDISVFSSNLSNNEAHQRGGAVYAVDSLYIEGTTIANNQSGFLGGGASGDDVIILNTSFTANHCEGNPCWGGGLASGSTLDITGSSFANNSTAGIGGGIYVVGPSQINETFFSQNTASLSGGASYHDIFGTAEYTNVVMDNNVSTQPGTAIHINNNEVMTITHGTIANRLTGLGEGIWNQNGHLVLLNSIIAYHDVGVRNDAVASATASVFFGNDMDGLGFVPGAGNFFTDPVFTAATLGNFNLEDGSSAIDNAQATSVTIDVVGNARPFGPASDIGAYEAGYDFSTLTIDFVGGPGGDQLPGQPIAFIITFANIGTLTARDVTINNIMPAEFSDLAFTSSRLITPTGGSPFVWDLGDLPPMSSGRITVTGKINQAVNATQIVTNNITIINNASVAQDSIGVAIAPPQVVWLMNPVNVNEPDGQVVVSLTLSAANPYADAVINYQTVNGSATAGEDFVAASGTVIFPAGSSVSTEQIQITILNNIVAEGDESFTISLSPAGAEALAPATIIIIDDDIGIYLPVIVGN